MCKFKCPCGDIGIKIVRALCYGDAYFECHNCSKQIRSKKCRTSYLNFTDEKIADIRMKSQEAYMTTTGYRYPGQNP